MGLGVHIVFGIAVVIPLLLIQKPVDVLAVIAVAWGFIGFGFGFFLIETRESDPAFMDLRMAYLIGWCIMTGGVASKCLQYLDGIERLRNNGPE